MSLSVLPPQPSGHLVKRDAEGRPAVQPGREETMENLHRWVQENVERLYRLAELK
jgi:hypothetical protein